MGSVIVPQLPGVTNRFVYDSHVEDSRKLQISNTYIPTDRNHNIIPKTSFSQLQSRRRGR
jgi:hypothetical protein